MRLGGIVAQRVVCCMIAALALGLTGCGLRDLDVLSQATPTPSVLSQWAASATASSSYAYLTGARIAPPVFQRSARVLMTLARGLLPAATGESGCNSRIPGRSILWLSRFTRPMAGALCRVVLLDPEGTPMTVWEGLDTTEPCPGVLEVRFEITSTQVSVVRIDLDESRTGTWNQIDAVELVGIP